MMSAVGDSFTDRACVAIVAVLTGCNSAAVFYVPTGASDRLSRWNGACDVSRAQPVGPVEFRGTGGDYVARSPGRVRVPCARGSLELDVRTAARIEIDPQGEIGAGNIEFRVRAFDRGGHELDPGRDTSVEWSFSGALRSRSSHGCGDIILICPAASHGFAVAAPGHGSAEAAAFGLRARAEHVVRP